MVITNSFEASDEDYWDNVKFKEDYEGRGILDDTLYKHYPYAEDIKKTVKDIKLFNTALSAYKGITGLPDKAEMINNISNWKSISSYKYVNYIPRFEYYMKGMELVEGLSEIIIPEIIEAIVPLTSVQQSKK